MTSVSSAAQDKFTLISLLSEVCKYLRFKDAYQGLLFSRTAHQTLQKGWVRRSICAFQTVEK